MESHTIDELARAAGVTTTTIRLYQGKGLLPGPEMRGRVGHYGAAHLARQRLIGALQERGFSLAAIRVLVDTWERGATLGDVLGLEEQLAGPPEEPLVLDGEAFAALFPSGVVDPALARRAVELGLVELRGADVVVRRPRFLRIGQELVGLGLSMDDVLEEYAHLKGVADDVAGRFADLFERRFSDGPRRPAVQLALELPGLARFVQLVVDAVGGGPLAGPVGGTAPRAA